MNDDLMVVECMTCQWVDSEDKLIKKYDNVEMSTLEHCPNCDDAWSLVEVGFAGRKKNIK